MSTRWISLAAAAAMMLPLAACPPPQEPAPLPPVSTGKVRVRVFTEPSAVKGISAAGRYLFVATDDSLERWDAAGKVMVMTVDHGLSGAHVTALAPDLDRKWMWVLTDGGLGRYDASSEVYTDVPSPPLAMGIDYAELSRDGAIMAPAAEGGVWMGTSKGLLFASDRGGWLALPIKDPVRALVRDRAGWLWIAAKSGLFARKPNGDIVKIDAAAGSEIAEPRLLALAPGDRVMAIGTDDEGHERIAFGKGMQWSSYRALPEIAWDAAVPHGVDAVMLMGAGHVYRLARAMANSVQPLSRDAVRLMHSGGADAGDWTLDPVDLVLPPGATAMGAVDDQLLIGTRDLGTARYRAGDPHPQDWLRRKQMFEDATALTVACAKPADCWIATGAHQAWHWTGERLTAAGPDEVIAAVARDPSGALYAVHHVAGERVLHMSKIDGPTWTPVAKVELTTPGDAPEISFARFTAPGTLWLGLRYKDGAEHRSFGIAIVDVAGGKVAYHRAGAEAQAGATTAAGAGAGSAAAVAAKMLPIPVGVVDAVVRGDTAWLATDEGVARVVGNQVKIWTEADGLRSELARAIAIAPDGSVIVATGAGAMIYDGKAWAFPPALQFEINDLVTTKNGQVWMATERGIAAWDGKKVRRVDTRRGLAENLVLDLAADQFDRVWARGPGSLTLISQ